MFKSYHFSANFKPPLSFTDPVLILILENEIKSRIYIYLKINHKIYIFDLT